MRSSTHLLDYKDCNIFCTCLERKIGLKAAMMTSSQSRQSSGSMWFWLTLALWIWNDLFLSISAWGIDSSSKRYTDMPFKSPMTILNQTVSCGRHRPGQFVAKTFTCADIRVNGKRLAYGFYKGWSVGDLRCQETQGIHEFAQLCRLMLAFNKKQSLGIRAVYIPNSTCDHLNEPRKLLKKITETHFRWTDLGPGRGWTETIQCMTV